MKTVIQTFFEDGDMKLLQSVPEEPCAVCAERRTGACCGCPEQNVWAEKYGKELRERNLMDCFHAYYRYLGAQQAVNDAKKALAKAREDCQKLGFDIGSKNEPYTLEG